MKTPSFRPRSALWLALACAAAVPASAEEAASVASMTPPTVPAVADDPLVALQERWAQIKYRTPEAAQAAAFEALAADAARARDAHPRDARLLTWSGIILASQAGAEGGLGALSLCKAARRDLEAAIAIDPAALSGSAYTSLGSLYYQVPGWPLGFGDDDTARRLLEQALAIDPDGIDANYFYGDFLREQGEFARARDVLEHALQAPARPGRELADEGRRGEIRAALAAIEAKRGGP